MTAIHIFGHNHNHDHSLKATIMTAASRCTAVLCVAALCVGIMLYALRDILIPLCVAVFFFYLLQPIVNALNKVTTASSSSSSSSSSRSLSSSSHSSLRTRLHFHRTVHTPPFLRADVILLLLTLISSYRLHFHHRDHPPVRLSYVMAAAGAVPGAAVRLPGRPGGGRHAPNGQPTPHTEVMILSLGCV
jgi:hypothetical protein